jgi:uncharacterized protein
MLKFLLIAALVLWLLFSPGVRKLLRNFLSAGAKESPPAQGTESVNAVPMLACAHCGVHLPSTDALLNEANQPFCSEAHRQAGARPA